MADEVLNLYSQLSPSEQDAFVDELSTEEAEELLRSLRQDTSPVPSRIAAPTPQTAAEKEPGFFDELFDVGGLVEDYGAMLSRLKTAIGEEYSSEAQQSVPGVLRPFTTAGGLAGKAIYGAGKEFVENPVEMTGRTAAQAVPFLLGGPVGGALLAPVAGELFDATVDATSGELKTPGQYGEELRRSYAFEGPAALISAAPAIAKGGIKAPALDIYERGRKLVTGEKNKAFERGKNLSKPGRLSTSLGAVDRNKTELPMSSSRLDAEPTLIDEGIFQDLDFNKPLELTDIDSASADVNISRDTLPRQKYDTELANELTKRIESRISDYQTIETDLLTKADAAGVTVDVAPLIDPDTIRGMLDVPEGSFEVNRAVAKQFPGLARLLKQSEFSGKAKPLTPTEANSTLKEVQSYLRTIGAYDERRLAPSQQEALRTEKLLRESSALAASLNNQIDTAVNKAVDVSAYPAGFAEVNRRQHDLLIYKDVPNEFITRRLGTESGERTNVTEPRGISARVGNKGNFFLDAQEAIGKAVDVDQANIARGEIQRDTLRMLEDAKLSARYQGGQDTPPMLPSQQAAQEAAKRLDSLTPTDSAIGLGAVTAAQEPIPQPAPTPEPEGITSSSAAGMLSRLLGPATANAEEMPMPGAEAVPMLQAAMPKPQPIPRDPDIIAATPEHIRTLMTALSPNTAQLVVDALETKDLIKRRLAFSVALQEAPDLFEGSVTGAKSEIRVGNGFVLGDPREIPLIKARLTARFRQGEIRSDALAKQISALNDPTDQRLFPEPPYASMEQELSSAIKRPSSPQEALSRATPRTINTPAGERRIYLEGATSERGKSVNDNAKQVAKALKQRGYSSAAIAGILGNLEVETGGSFDYEQRQVKGPAVGLFQFDFMKPYYKAWLQKTGYDDSLDAQVEYVDRVIKGDEPMLGAADKRALQKALEMDDPVAIAEIFSNHFLKPGKPHLERRKKAAEKFAGLLGVSTDRLA